MLNTLNFEEVQKAISQTSLGKVPGSDLVPTEVYKMQYTRYQQAD